MGKKSRPHYCRLCLRTAPKGERISKTGLCPECGIKRETQNATELATRQGEMYLRWGRSMRIAGERVEQALLNNSNENNDKVDTTN